MAAGATIIDSTGGLSHDEPILAQILVHLAVKEQRRPRRPAFRAAPLEAAGEAEEKLDRVFVRRTVE